MHFAVIPHTTHMFYGSSLQIRNINITSNLKVGQSVLCTSQGVQPFIDKICYAFIKNGLNVTVGGIPLPPPPGSRVDLSKL